MKHNKPELPANQRNPNYHPNGRNYSCEQPSPNNASTMRHLSIADDRPQLATRLAYADYSNHRNDGASKFHPTNIPHSIPPQRGSQPSTKRRLVADKGRYSRKVNATPSTDYYDRQASRESPVVSPQDHVGFQIPKLVNPNDEANYRHPYEHVFRLLQYMGYHPMTQLYPTRSCLPASRLPSRSKYQMVPYVQTMKSVNSYQCGGEEPGAIERESNHNSTAFQRTNGPNRQLNNLHQSFGQYQRSKQSINNHSRPSSLTAEHPDPANCRNNFVHRYHPNDVAEPLIQSDGGLIVQNTSPSNAAARFEQNRVNAKLDRTSSYHPDFGLESTTKPSLIYAPARAMRKLTGSWMLYTGAPPPTSAAAAGGKVSPERHNTVLEEKPIGNCVGTTLSYIMGNAAFKVLTLVLIGTNLGFFMLNVYVTHSMRTKFGMMHPYTMTSVITGLLPLHNSVNMMLYWLGISDHRQLMRSLKNAFSHSRDPAADAIWMRRAQRKLFFVFFLATIIPLVARLIQCGLLPDLFTQWHGPVSLFIVPLLRAWQIVPLLYFWILCATLQMRFNRLRNEINRDSSCQYYTIESHFDQFRHTINISQRLTNFLSSFICASLVFAVLSLCLTVYFVTHAKELINLNPEIPLPIRINIYFDYGWGILQVILAIAYAICICKFGWTVNEEARGVIRTALCMKPRTDDDRFQILRFQQLLFSQMSWGISVWKAFLIERSFLFTLTSTIVAYALVLLRLKASVGGSAPSEPQNTTIVTNSTS